MKPWHLNRRVSSLAQEITDPIKTQTKIAYGSLSEPERVLLDKVQEIVDKYSPASPPQDVIAKNAELWNKGLEIFARRIIDLFVEVIPATLCCDELEKWYFKLYLYNFWLDWTESLQKLREMPKEQKEALFLDYKEMGILDKVFRFPKDHPEKTKNQNLTEGDKR